MIRAAFFLVVSIQFTACAGHAQSDYLDGSIPSIEQIYSDYRDAEGAWPDIPEQLQMAFLALEDPDFFETLAQDSRFAEQIAITFYAPLAERSAARQLRLQTLSVSIAAALTHEEILDWYVNTVFMGRHCYGVQSAAIAYFGTDLNALTLLQAAYLASVSRQPGLLNPTGNLERIEAERDEVVLAMLENGFISPSAAIEATESDLGFSNPPSDCPIPP